MFLVLVTIIFPAISCLIPFIILCKCFSTSHSIWKRLITVAPFVIPIVRCNFYGQFAIISTTFSRYMLWKWKQRSLLPETDETLSHSFHRHILYIDCFLNCLVSLVTFKVMHRGVINFLDLYWMTSWLVTVYI